MDIVAHFSGRFNPAIYFTLTFIHSFPYEGEAIGKQTPRTYSWVYVRQYCDKIDEAAQNRMELIMRSLAKQNGVTEQLKAENQMEWVRQMNACKAQAEEIVKFELIYD